MTRHVEELDRERASLASTIDRIQDRVSVEALAGEALGVVRSQAVSISRSVDAVVRTNPIAVALTGIGIAWLVFGSRSRRAAAPSREDDENRWLDEGGALATYDEGVHTGSQVPHSHEWAHEANRIRQEASASLERIDQDERAQSKAGAAYRSARDFATERARVVADFSAGLKDSFLDGLDGLSEAARERIVSVRQSAYAAGLKAERLARRSRREAGRLFEDHPLIAGALAAVAGSALAAMLPRTRTEDAVFGRNRDRLMREAAKLLEGERDRAERIAKGVGEELGVAARAIGEGVRENLDDAARSVKKRVREDAVAATAVDPVDGF